MPDKKLTVRQVREWCGLAMLSGKSTICTHPKNNHGWGLCQKGYCPIIAGLKKREGK
jgi:hypothetical protein